MPDNIPDGLQRPHFIKAIHQYRSGVEHQFGESTVYDLVFEGHRYPPKAIVGIAAEILTGQVFGPKDFKGGQESKCFRILQKSGFEIDCKPSATTDSAWLFQGNPKRFDIDDYLLRYTYIYWRAPSYKQEIRLGDLCVIWRSGNNAGAIAIGKIAETPQPMDGVNFPECLGEDLWSEEADSPDTTKVGIKILEARLDEEAGFIPRIVFKNSPQLGESSNIRNAQGTVFRLTKDEMNEIKSLWNPLQDLPNEGLSSGVEGARRLRTHYSQERNRKLVELKKKAFANENQGQIFCEVCTFDFSKVYPSALVGDGFIEVHHLTPLFADSQPRKTTLNDLLLICSNCHRMVHRSKDVEENLTVLQEHFNLVKGETNG